MSSELLGSTMFQRLLRVGRDQSTQRTRFVIVKLDTQQRQSAYEHSALLVSMYTGDTQRKRFVARIHSALNRILGAALDSEFHELRIEKVRRASPRLMLKSPDEILFELGQRFARRATDDGY